MRALRFEGVAVRLSRCTGTPVRMADAVATGRGLRQT
jgi:hypothetical protein